MPTIQQRFRWGVFKDKKHQWASALLKCPQVGGVVVRARILTPRKPNSAKRPVAKVFLSNGDRCTAHIPGIGHNLRRYSSVLIRGGGARDLPGVFYACIRGALDFAGIVTKIRRRSIYGAKLPKTDEFAKQKRRKFRKI